MDANLRAGRFKLCGRLAADVVKCGAQCPWSNVWASIAAARLEAEVNEESFHVMLFLRPY